MSTNPQVTPRHRGKVEQQLINQNNREYTSLKQRMAAESEEERKAKAQQALEDVWGTE